MMVGEGPMVAGPVAMVAGVVPQTAVAVPMVADEVCLSSIKLLQERVRVVSDPKTNHTPSIGWDAGHTAASSIRDFSNPRTQFLPSWSPTHFRQARLHRTSLDKYLRTSYPEPMTSPGAQQRTISVGQIRQNPTRMIREVRDGASYVLTDHGVPTARIIPFKPAPVGRRTTEEVLELLARPSTPLWDRDRREFRESLEFRDPWSEITP